MRAGRCNAVDGGLTSPTLGVGGNLLCEIVQFGLFRVAHASRVLVSASRRNSLFLERQSRTLASHTKSPRRRDTVASTRDACATQSVLLRWSFSCRSFAPRRKLRRHLHQARRRLSKSSSRPRGSTFHSINR